LNLGFKFTDQRVVLLGLFTRSLLFGGSFVVFLVDVAFEVVKLIIGGAWCLERSFTRGFTFSVSFRFGGFFSV
jgi:hypothetical protein